MKTSINITIPFLLAALLTFAQPRPAQQQAPQAGGQSGTAKEAAKPGRIEGRVVSSTGEPIARAQVRAVAPTTVQNGNAVPGGQYAATTDETGGFVIDKIDPSPNLQLTAQKPGYLNTRYGQRTLNGPAAPLAIAEGQVLKNLLITMTPQGVVTGRVTDVNGDPLQGVNVMLLRRGYQRGVRQLVTTASANTNDQGEYRIANVAAGRYYLRATQNAAAAAISASGPDGTMAPIPTFYPNGTDPQSAAPIDVVAGQELRGIDVQLRQGRVFSASGKVAGWGGGTGTVVVAPRASSSAADILTLAQSRLTQQVRPDGNFTVRNLSPGAYIAQVITPTNNQTRSVGSLEFSIGNQDVTDLVIPVGSGLILQGTVTVEGGDVKDLMPAASAEQNPNSAALAIAAATAGVAVSGVSPSFGLQPVVSTPIGGTSSARMEQNGTFKLDGIVPGSYYLVTGGWPSGYYLKSASYGGVDVIHQPLDLTRGGGGAIQLVVGRTPPSLSGTAINDKGEAQSGVMVSVWPEQLEAGQQNLGVRVATTNATGGFQVQGLRPGKYYAAAFEDVDAGLANAPDFLNLLKSEAVEVELKEGGSASPQLKLIPVAKSKAAEEKLP